MLKPLDRRKRLGNSSPCLLTQCSIASVEHNVEMQARALGSEFKWEHVRSLSALQIL